MTQQMCKLGDVCRIFTGGTPSRTKSEYFGGGIPWVKITDMLQGIVITTDETIALAGIENSSAKLLPVGTVLISIFATIGRTAVLGIEAATNQAIAGVVPHDIGRLDSQYLRFYLDSQHGFLNREARGVAQPNINQGILKNLDISIPSLSEQRRIVDLLSRAEGIVRLRWEVEKKAAELIPALFLDMFGDPATNPKGWPVATVGSVLEAADYGSSSKASSDGAGLPMIRMGNITYAGQLDLADLKYVKLPQAEIERYSLHEGDILFNRTNSKELVGKTGLWNVSLKAIVASYFIRLRVQRAVVSPYFLWGFMNTAHMKRAIFDTARGAIGQSNINSKELKAFPLPVPPLLLQEQFALRCADVSGVATQQSAATTKAQAAFDALLASIFDGGGRN
ncbi:MAG: restriction endonuclease subunit S [Dechloromonas sp.]|nr:MAG: restriction endonuclease subunit S [Dechloromonas sp.]